MPYASAPFVLRAVDRSRKNRPANTLRARRCRVHRIPSRVRDDRDTPLVRDETAEILVLIWGDREGNCFYGRGWTRQIELKYLAKFVFARRRRAKGLEPHSASIECTQSCRRLHTDRHFDQPQIAHHRTEITVVVEQRPAIVDAPTITPSLVLCDAGLGCRAIGTCRTQRRSPAALAA